MPPRCPDRFAGTFDDWMREADATFLDAAALRAGHEAVAAALHAAPVLVVRSFRGFTSAGRLESVGRGADAVRFVVGDNEPAVWFRRRLSEAPRATDLPTALADQTLPISLAPSEGDTPDEWRTWGTGDAPHRVERWRGVDGGRWKLCHVFDAAPAHLGARPADVRARFVRAFHPLNVFWFASEYRWRRGHYVMSPSPRLGEWAPLRRAFWNEHAARYPELARWFLEHANVAATELPENGGSSPGTFSFHWVPTAAAPSAATSAPPSLLAPREVVVRENGEGRFHLQGFGAALGGPERAHPITFSVRARDGSEIARSRVTTAIDIAIAQRSQGDYDANRFRITDFVVLDEDQNVVPRAAAAKRAWGLSA